MRRCESVKTFSQLTDFYMKHMRKYAKDEATRHDDCFNKILKEILEFISYTFKASKDRPMMLRCMVRVACFARKYSEDSGMVPRKVRQSKRPVRRQT